ncbi:hypothetical protein MKY14_16100 [Paenibacillus sp. FSL R5-0887]|uniref:hypothetical protein n=1 Tax=Paenibacillus sp. FSL R5-0887 TaxID=2921662 RepID=UPI0030F5ABD8
MSDQEREIRVNLLDGSEVIMNTGDRVLFQASSPGAIPLSIDPEIIMDDVLAALEESQQEGERLNEICKQLAGEEMLFQDGKYETEMQMVQGKLVEAQQTIARHEEALNGIIAYSTDKNAVDIASESMGYPEDENEEKKCGYCTGRPLVDRKPLMKSQLSDYSVFINSANYLEDSVIGGSVPHSLYGVRIKFCPVCGKELVES